MQLMAIWVGVQSRWPRPWPSTDFHRSLGIQAGIRPLYIATLSWSGGPSWNGIANREIQVRNLLGVTGIQMEFNGIVKHSSIQLLGAAAERARKSTRLAPSVCKQAHSSRRSARVQAVSVSVSSPLPPCCRSSSFLSCHLSVDAEFESST